MVPQSNYTLADVLAVAKIHPFYDSNVQYPPDADTIRAVREQAAKEDAEALLKTQPLLRKQALYTAIGRLVHDASPQNTYRHSIYASVTGGGSGSKPLFFATDVHENRRHRAYFGNYLREMGLLKPTDWVLSTHIEGELYRSLDLTLEIMENAGASLLAAGNLMEPDEVVRLLNLYHVNVLTGDSAQIVRVVCYIANLSAEERAKIKLEKIIYTSEKLTKAQRAHIIEVLGPITICSVIGSAEAGPYAIHNPDLTGQKGVEGCEDFVFDTRLTMFEVLPLSASEDDSILDSLPDGEAGVVAQTLLARLRNPVVRYITGDIGSLHPLPERARDLVPEEAWPYLRVLRLQGRDRRFCFEFDGSYIEFDKVEKMMNDPECGLLQWQIVLDKLPPTMVESSLEVRVLCAPRNEYLISTEELSERIGHFFHSCSENRHRYKMVFHKDLSGFEVSKTGGKIMKFIDRFNA